MVRGVPLHDLEAQSVRDGRVSRLLPRWLEPLDVAEVGAISLTASPSSALPALTVRRNRKGIGRFLTEARVLLVNTEADREAALTVVEEAGFDVLRPLPAAPPGEVPGLVFNGLAKPIGAWGNVVGFEVEVTERMIHALVALVDLDTRELYTISNVLTEPVVARLARMGVEIDVAHPPNPVGKLSSKLWWFTESWETPFTDVEPRFRVPKGAPLQVSEHIAAELPAEIVAAWEEQLRGDHFDPMPSTADRASWECTNGVLDRRDVAEYRRLAPDGVALPADWEELWESALHLSRVHAPTLCAFFLHDCYPDWWDALPLTVDHEGGTWLVGHSMSQPEWLREDMTLDSDRRLRCAVSLIVSAVDIVGDLNDLRALSREEMRCTLCGRGFEAGMLQAGEVYQFASATACSRCHAIGWPSRAKDVTPLQHAGILEQIRYYIRATGGVVSVSMLWGFILPLDKHADARWVLDRPLPAFVTGNWTEWLGLSGVLGESWRPSFGQVSVANDGHLCRSLLERIIDDFLSVNGIDHEPEPPYPYDAVLNEHGSRADWRLADGTFVEAAGMLDSAAYAAKIERKRELAAKHGLNLVVVDPDDLPHLAEVFNVDVFGDVQR